MHLISDSKEMRRKEENKNDRGKETDGGRRMIIIMATMIQPVQNLFLLKTFGPMMNDYELLKIYFPI